MEMTPPADPVRAVQVKQQQDAKALFERLQQIEVTDLNVPYSPEYSSVTLPAVLIRLLVLAVLFRLNSTHKWHAVFRQKLLPQPLQTWLDIKDLAELAEHATVNWIPAGVLLDTLAWQVARCLTQYSLPQPMAVIRQTIRDLLLREAVVSEGGLVLNRSFWRRLAKKGHRALAAGLLAECRQRIEFVLGQFDFVAQLLACSYSRYGRRAHHPLLMISDAAAKHLTPLLGWLIGECRSFCQATGREDLSEADRALLLQAFESLDWKALGNFARNR